MFHTGEKSSRVPKALLSIVIVIAMLLGIVPQNRTTLTANAAVVPKLTLSLGKMENYSVGSDTDTVSYSKFKVSSDSVKASLSGSTVTMKEVSANKNYNFGYVPIIASVDVPANTTYQTTMSFKITGNPNKSSGKSTALAFVELFDFGSEDKKSSLTFNTSEKKKNDNSSGYTAIHDVRETKDFTGSYNLTVTFANDTSSDKTVSYYFGLFTGCKSAKSYTHQVNVKCAISYGKLYDGAASAKIKANADDARHNVNSTHKDSYSKSQFLPDKPVSELTDDDCELMDLHNGMKNYWDHRFRIYIGNNKLTFSKATNTARGRMSYVPFSVQISVPAYTERTYYVTFEISYTRGSDSGAGFFAELIEGGVPNSFNTSTGAEPTGNTKLRVYSDGGGKTKVHRGTVTLPLSLKNDTSSAKTMGGDYVFFAGYRQVGWYDPDPEYNLQLTSVTYASYDDINYASVTANNCTYTHNNNGAIKPNEDYNLTVTPKTGYKLPTSVTVKCGGTTLSTSKYTWNSSTGKLNIKAKEIKGGITVTANGVPLQYNITYSGLTGATLSTKPTKHTYGTATTVGNPSKTGYTFAGWKVNGGSTATKSLKLGATSYTANISLEATWTANKYNATFSGTNTTKSTGFGTNTVTYNTAWTGKFTANTGYDLPSSITVSVGGTTLASSKYTYSKNGSTGTVTISAANVTGAVSVTAGGTAKKYSAELSGTNVSVVSGFGTSAVTYKTQWTGTIKANSGYVLPDSVTVMIGNTRLTSSQYTYSKSTGKITITAANVTGYVTVTASGHQHTYTSAVTTAATCTSTGVRTYTCSCGHKYTETIAKTAHSYSEGWTTSATQHWHVCQNCGAAGTKSAHTWNSGAVTTEPTISSTGVKTFTCTACSATKTETLPMLDHTHNTSDGEGEWSGKDDEQHWHECDDGCGTKVEPEDHTLKLLETKPSTCTENGYEEYKCEECQHVVTVKLDLLEHVFSEEYQHDDDNHWHVCTVCKTAKGGNAAHEWDNGTVEQLADCTNTGVMRHECGICGASKTADIPVDAEAHDWGDWEVSAAPTEQNKGEMKSVCKRDAQHVKTEELPALSDTGFWSLVSSSEPSCTADGEKVYACEYLQAAIAIPAKGHTSVTDAAVAPTCTETGLSEGQHCSVCNDVLTEQSEINALGHDWNEGEITTPPGEDTAGERTYTCKVCGATKTEPIAPLNHVHDWDTEWSSDDTQHWHDCLNGCGEKNDAANHVWNSGTVTKEPTADEDGEKTFECTVCKETKIEAVPAKGTTTDDGSISKEVKPGENAPETKLETPLEELIEAVLTPDEQDVIKNGIDIKIILTVDDATKTVSADDKTKVQTAIGGLANHKLGQYLDVNLLKIIGESQEKITETNAPIKVTFEIPANLRGKQSYSVIRLHNGETNVLRDLDSDVNTVTIETDKFSTYALAYREKTSSSGGSSGGGSRPTTPATYRITANADEGGYASGGGEYYRGDTAEISAAPDSGYRFVGWYEDGELISTSSDYTFTVRYSRTFTARFEKIDDTSSGSENSGSSETSSSDENSSNSSETSGGSGETSGGSGETSGGSSETSGSSGETSGNSGETSGNSGDTSGNNSETSSSSSETSGDSSETSNDSSSDLPKKDDDMSGGDNNSKPDDNDPPDTGAAAAGAVCLLSAAAMFAARRRKKL